MRIDVITIFPELFDVPLRTSIIGRAAEAGIVDYGIHDLREHGLGRHRSVDDEPYGGGAGMVMRPEPLFAAIEPLRAAGAEVVLLDPAGERLTDALARDLARSKPTSRSCAVATRGSTIASGPWSTARSASATTSSPAASCPPSS